MRLDGKVAVVTGSGGKMGGGIALRLAEEGADILLNDRVDGRTDAFEAPIRAMGRDVASVLANVTRREGARELIEAAERRWGRVDILVNVVGGIRGSTVNPLAEMSEEDWEFAIGLNLRATFHCTQLVLPGMIARRVGKIVNIASVSWAGDPQRIHYSTAKAGVVAFTRSAATQLAPYNINVNAVAPGLTLAPEEEYGERAREVVASGQIPLGRVNVPRDV